MFDELLHQKEIQLEDAKRKLAWYMEEYREIEPSPILKEYHYLESKPRAEFTPAETARLEELSKLQEPFQFYRNEFNRLRAGRALAAAESDLEAYKKIINLAENPASVLIDKKTPDAICDAATAAASDNGGSQLLLGGCFLLSLQCIRILLSLNFHTFRCRYLCSCQRG